MCTVVCRWSPGAEIPVQLLALRDEWASRTFDLPAAWWPGQPRVVGGRDRLGGGTWCASDVRSGSTAVLLNRGDRPLAAPGAPSRGVLPLLAVDRLDRWPAAIELAGMASFNLVLAQPEALNWWYFDGQTLRGEQLAPGSYLFTPRGLAGPPADRRFAGLNDRLADRNAPTERAWSAWLPIVTESVPSTDPLELLVRIPRGTDSFETVFGQFIAARPGSLRLDYVRTPDRHDAWTVRYWQLRDGVAQPEPVADDQHGTPGADRPS